LIDSITQIRKIWKDGRNLYSRLASSRPSGVFGRALRFYILNRITYSGIADSGGYSAESFERRFTKSKIDALLFLSKLLNNVEITDESYERLLLKKGKDVFIFLDPPYWKARSFSLYGKNGLMNRFFDHRKFAENVRKCKHKWLITCDDAPEMRDLFSFAPHIYSWKMMYSGLHKKKAIQGKELFITNYEPESALQLTDLTPTKLTQYS
jgi:DNA adenine methylase